MTDAGTFTHAGIRTWTDEIAALTRPDRIVICDGSEAEKQHLNKVWHRLSPWPDSVPGLQRLKSRYLNACDQQDPESAKECFAEGEVEIDMGHVGVFRSRDQFAALYKAAGCHPHVLDLHHGGNPEIDFTDDENATGLWSLDYRNINLQEKTVTFVSLLYHDEYAKIGGVWKISAIRFARE